MAVSCSIVSTTSTLSPSLNNATQGRIAPFAKFFGKSIFATTRLLIWKDISQAVMHTYSIVFWASPCLAFFTIPLQMMPLDSFSLCDSKQMQLVVFHGTLTCSLTAVRLMTPTTKLSLRIPLFLTLKQAGCLKARGVVMGTLCQLQRDFSKICPSAPFVVLQLCIMTLFVSYLSISLSGSLENAPPKGVNSQWFPILITNQSHPIKTSYPYQIIHQHNSPLKTGLPSIVVMWAGLVGQYFRMIFISPTNTKRFTLYHMQENEIYIQDFFGNCSFHDFASNEPKTKDKGKFYMCSKTIVYESDNKNIPLTKFKFESMKTLPQFTTDAIKFTITRITTIKVAGNSPPEPFRIYEDITEQITIYPSYQNVKNLQEWIIFLYQNSKKKSNYYFQESVYQMIIDKFNKKSFNMSKIDSVSEKPMLEESNVLTRRVLPLNSIYGYIFITDEKIYFQPFHNLAGNTVEKIEIAKIEKLFKKRYQLREIGLEITTDRSYYFTFETQAYRNRIYSILAKRVPVSCFKIDQLENVTLQWQTRQITNFDYLTHLNQASNRSTSDLSQYPVFPWVISDYVSEKLDLNDPKIYRDLSKPIGAINQQRLQGLLQRYEGMQPPKFMYGSHYSTPGYVIGYLVRKKPEYMLKLQSGRFDKPDRLFKSIKDDWYNVMENPTSLKELIPQFYLNDSSFLKNYQNLDLGVRQNKKKVGDVKIPQWANADPDTFLKINRQALESQYVSDNLHKWIDLIFGYKQRGQQAIKAYNLFHPFTYQGMIDIEKIKDPIQKMGIKCQINQFGQCPKQIFKIPHPSRNSNQPIFADAFSKGNQEDEEDENSREEEFRSVPIKINSIKNVESSGLFSLGKPKVKTVLSMGKESQLKLTDIPKAHKTQINRALHLKSKPNTLLTIGQDGFLKIFDVYEKNCTKSFKICEFNLSAIVMLKSDQVFAIGAWDNNIYIFNIVYGSKSKPFPAHDNSIIDIVYMPKRKTIVSASWDCSIKMFRYVGNVLDNQQHFYDHQNQITSITVNRDQNIVAFGDIEGNIICLSIEEKQQLFSFNMNSQKITRMHFIQNNVIIAAETEVRIVDAAGNIIGSHLIDKNNGTVNDMQLDNQHLFITTSNKQLILYDILQQKKIGNYFNDFTFSTKDKLPEEKGLTFITPGNDGLFLAIGGISGTIYLLRSG